MRKPSNFFPLSVGDSRLGTSVGPVAGRRVCLGLGRAFYDGFLKLDIFAFIGREDLASATRGGVVRLTVVAVAVAAVLAGDAVGVADHVLDLALEATVKVSAQQGLDHEPEDIDYEYCNKKRSHFKTVEGEKEVIVGTGIRRWLSCPAGR